MRAYLPVDKHTRIVSVDVSVTSVNADTMRVTGYITRIRVDGSHPRGVFDVKLYKGGKFYVNYGHLTKVCYLNEKG